MTPQTRALLQTFLHDPDHDVRLFAGRDLGARPDARAAAPAAAAHVAAAGEHGDLASMVLFFDALPPEDALPLYRDAYTRLHRGQESMRAYVERHPEAARSLAQATLSAPDAAAHQRAAALRMIALVGTDEEAVAALELAASELGSAGEAAGLVPRLAGVPAALPVIRGLCARALGDERLTEQLYWVLEGHGGLAPEVDALLERRATLQAEREAAFAAWEAGRR